MHPARPSFIAALLVGMVPMLVFPASAQNATPPKPGAPEIDLKLFEKGEKDADRSKGCTIALWQANRDPEHDKYALLFVQQLRGKDHAREPARIKVGNATAPLTRIAVGGKTNGYGLHEVELYRFADGDGYVALDLKLGPLEGEAVEIESGKMMVSYLGKETFRASVKGGAGCMGAPLPNANAPSAPAQKAPVPPVGKKVELPEFFEPYKVEPKQFTASFRKEVQQKFKCNPEVMKGAITGYSLSEESAIWEIPCDRFAYQASSIFALVYVMAPERQHSYLKTPVPAGIQRVNDPGVLMNPKWDIKSRTVTSVSLARGAGDCGVMEKYRVTPEGEFALVEYREKAKCDGVAVPAEQYPLVFPKR